MNGHEARWRDVRDGALISDRGHEPERVGGWLYASDVLPSHWYRMIGGRYRLINPDAYVFVIDTA